MSAVGIEIQYAQQRKCKGSSFSLIMQEQRRFLGCFSKRGVMTIKNIVVGRSVNNGVVCEAVNIVRV